jgi:hypothetical protein
MSLKSRVERLETSFGLDANPAIDALLEAILRDARDNPRREPQNVTDEDTVTPSNY